MIHVEPIPEERAVKVCCEFKIKKDAFETSVNDILMRDAIEARMMRKLHKELDEMYYNANIQQRFSQAQNPMMED